VIILCCLIKLDTVSVNPYHIFPILPTNNDILFMRKEELAKIISLPTSDLLQTQSQGNKKDFTEKYRIKE
jgi:hypothetical protein